MSIQNSAFDVTAPARSINNTMYHKLTTEIVMSRLYKAGLLFKFGKRSGREYYEAISPVFVCVYEHGIEITPHDGSSSQDVALQVDALLSDLGLVLRNSGTVVLRPL